MSPLSPRALAFEQPEAVRNQGGGDQKQNSTIGMILGCVVVVVGIFIVSFAIIIRKRRKRDAARGTRLLDPVYEVPSTELVPWLTQGSPTQTRLVQQFSTSREPLLPPNPEYNDPALPPSPNYSRLPQTGHHSASPSSDSSIPPSQSNNVETEFGGEAYEGSPRRGQVERQETSSTVLSEQPPPYTSGTSGVGADLTPTRTN
ncbi:hypothetical protein JCM5350_003536 [Sporobolomyces pararoseus]